RPRPWAHRAPTVVMDRPVSHHFKVLGNMIRGCACVVENVSEAVTFDRRLSNAFDRPRGLDAQRFENRQRKSQGRAARHRRSRRQLGTPGLARGSYPHRYSAAIIEFKDGGGTPSMQWFPSPTLACPLNTPARWDPVQLPPTISPLFFRSRS